ncbi:MAG: ATP-binding protein [Endomicrobiaceae bacterium]|nr:ATP-binding protein [Endomicrobiaceae bacterium]
MYSLYQNFLYISSIIAILLSIFVFIKNKKSQISFNFLSLSLSIFILLFSYAQMSGTYNLDIAFIWAKIGFIGIAFFPLSVFLFIFTFIDIKLKKSQYLLLVIPVLFFICLAIFSDLVIKEVAPNSWGIYPHAGKLYILFIGYSILMILFPIYNSYKYIQNNEVTSIKKQKVIYMMLVYLLSLVLFLFDNLFFYDIFVFEPILYLTTLFCLVSIIIIISSYNLTNVKVTLIKFLIFIFMLFLVLILSNYILVSSTNIYISNFLSFMLTIGCFLVYKKVIIKTEEVLLAQNRHYQNLLIHAASGMAKEHNLERLLKLIAIIVLKTIKVSFVAIFLENKQEQNFEIKILRSFSNKTSELMFSYDYEHPFVNFVRHKEAPFLFDEMPQYIAHSIILPFRAALVVPSFFEGVKGFMVIGEKNNKDIFTRDDISIFKMLARQTSLAMENCLFFDEYKQAQEKIFTAEKLASIGGLAEGIAHQIRNRLNQFSMISGELKYEIKDFKESNKNVIDSNTKLTNTFNYIDELSESLKNNVEKTDDVIKGILDYAKIESRYRMFEVFQLKEIVDLSYDLLKVKHRLSKKLKIISHFEDHDVFFGIKSQMMEVVYNLMDNAYEAIDEKFSMLKKDEQLKFVPKIDIFLIKKEKTNVFKISDNGIGIKEENVSKIFIPFFTTKASSKSGTGIGMYIVKRMVVENHNGKVWLESTYMHGTDIIIELPNI